MALLLKNLLFTFLVPGAVAGLVPWWITRGATPAPRAELELACALFALGGGIYAWCVWDFAAFGRGTPAPIEAPRRLVVRGLYRLVRNPMYVGVLCIVLGWGAWFRSVRVAGYALALGTCFHLFVVLYEEPHLERAFGNEYRAYKARVGRWLPRTGAAR